MGPSSLLRMPHAQAIYTSVNPRLGIWCLHATFTSPALLQLALVSSTSFSHYNMGGPVHKPGDWRVDVRFREKGMLQANASGVLLVPPEDALALVTDTAGDSLFRVVQRLPLPPGPDGSKRVEVVNKAAIRVLAWKIWTSNRVVYQIAPLAAQQQVPSCSSSTSSCGRPKAGGSDGSSIQEARSVSFNLLSSNMLHSLSGTWKLEPIKIHHSAIPTSFITLNSSSSSSSSISSKATFTPPTFNASKVQTEAAAQQQQLSHQSIKLLASSGSSSSMLPPGLSVDNDGNILATLVHYEQYAQPKGLPPGVRFVPGMSDAVRMSIGREVRQMLDKISHVSLLGVHHGLTPQDALTEVAHQLEQAGGSFKKLRKQLTAGWSPGAAGSTSSAANNAAEAMLGSKQPVMDVKALELLEAASMVA